LASGKHCGMDGYWDERCAYDGYDGMIPDDAATYKHGGWTKEQLV